MSKIALDAPPAAGEMQIRLALIDAGVKNLKEFGYSTASARNILTDTVYRAFFHSMLGNDENVAAARGRPALDKVRRALWEETRIRP